MVRTKITIYDLRITITIHFYLLWISGQMFQLRHQLITEKKKLNFPASIWALLSRFLNTTDWPLAQQSTFDYTTVNNDC